MSRGPEKRLRPWTFAGILLSYWCNARCAFCYLNCGPQHSVWVDPADAVRWWKQLADLAAEFDRRMKIHLTGGEPFGNWPCLLAIAEHAHAQGLTANGGFQKVETNAFWATGPAVVEERLRALDACGMGMLVVSADPFHQQFVPPENVRICVETARRVLGAERVRVRWADWYEEMIDLSGACQSVRLDLFRKHLLSHRERLTGRASKEVAELLPCSGPEAFEGQNCLKALLAGRHVHIDPLGNVFPGVCAGIVLGNAKNEPIASIWHRLAEHWQDDPILSVLIEEGPYGLYRVAKGHGFEPQPQGYASKCHLCAQVRRFLFSKSGGWRSLGPEEAYRY